MSFILDALKKSEAERQQKSGKEFASVPASADSPSAPRWLWFLALLLAINIVALTYLALRPSDTPGSAAAPGTAGQPEVAQPTSAQPLSVPAATAPAAAGSDVEPAPQPAAAEAAGRPDDFAARVAAARSSRSRPEPAEVAALPDTAAESQAGDATTTAATPPPAADPATAGNALLLPSYTDLRLDGDTDLPALHIDIHVFSQDPADRFVFINMNKYRERDRLAEGPAVHEITPEGVVLEHRGTRFLLPRD